jgi:cytoskeleton protein RodZ
MSSVGAYLRQLREARGVSLEEIARTTRVTASYLIALEADDFASLPVPVFTRGFIRAYCQALGESPDQALALFSGAVAPPSTAAATPPAAVAPSHEGAAAATRALSEPPPRNRGPVLISFVLLLVLGIALFAVTVALQSSREPPPERVATRSTFPSAPAVREPPPSTPAPGSGTQGRDATPARDTGTPARDTAARPRDAATSAPTAGAASTAPGTPRKPAAPASAGTGHRLVARTSEPTWIRVRTEEGKTTEETIPAGQTREWTSAGKFTLTVGNAGGVSLEVNGETLPPLGASGAVIPRLVVPGEAP